MKKTITIILLISTSVLLASCDAINHNNNATITASGTISAKEVAIAAEIGGKVTEVAVEEGQSVSQGDRLFKLDDELLQAQYEQAKASVEAADATLRTAQTQLASAQAQYELVLQTARLLDQQGRINAWKAADPSIFTLPVWYFQKDEDIQAAELEVQEAQEALQKSLTNLEKTLDDEKNKDFVEIEKRLAQAQIAYESARETLDQAKSAKEKTELVDATEDLFDAAETKLEQAQDDYDLLLSDEEYNDVLEARATAAVAQARYENALDVLATYQSGEQSLQVLVAKTAVDQAQAALGQAEANLKQAQAAAKTLEIQLAKTESLTPMDGIVLTRNLEVGETLITGSTAITIGYLDEVTMKVYIPEDQYGKIFLDQEVEISTDSYPGEVFTGKVVHIADKAEFTPRNVQTVEGRRATVYAVKVQIPNLELKLKPGMPADAEFIAND